MSGKFSLLARKKTLNCRGRLLVINCPLVMGIINLTPDSFHDGGKFNNPTDALKRAEKLLIEGATILDLGAYSSRPNAEHISEQEEKERLLPILKAIRTEFPEAFISIDTFRSSIANVALDVGADMINDISGGNLDAQLPKIAVAHNVPYVCMHMLGTPQTMQHQAVDGQIMPEILRFFSYKIAALTADGLHDIILDPGFGFGKTLDQNYELARHLSELGVFNQPILVGVSRKSMINKVLDTVPETALNGTTALHARLLAFGADILRVHEVKEAVEAVKIHITLNPSALS
jgi:dihydropteroate synthase